MGNKKSVELKDMGKVEEVERTENPSTYPVGSFVRVYRLPSKRERKNPPYWKKSMDCLVGEIGLVIKSFPEKVRVVFKNQDGVMLMLNCWLEPVLDVDTKFQNDLQDSWRNCHIARSFDLNEEKQCRSFYGKTGSLVQVISRVPKLKSTKGLDWENVKHTMSEYGIVCVGLDHGCTVVAFPKDDEKLTYTHFYADEWLRRVSWSDIENQEQKNQLEDLVAIVVQEKQKKEEKDKEDSSLSSSSSSASKVKVKDNDLRDVVTQLSLENVIIRKTMVDLEEKLASFEKKLQ